MPIVRILFLAVFILTATGAVAQKVKYKDIFALLETRQYEAAEPFLKKYLADEDDNPNAFLNMAIIYEQNMADYDILKESGELLLVIDSSLVFYDKALQTIDEKEIRKNREYYQAYNRRDLRTGEFGVKLSDIQFDIQKRKEALVERIDRIKMVNFYFDFADSLYRKSQALYAGIQSSGHSLNQFYLRSNDTTLLLLDRLVSRFDSTIRFVERYQSSLQTLGADAYKPEVTLVEINDLQTDGSSPVDFYSNDLRLWDYKTFATRSVEIIRNSIFPMRKDLVDTDVAIHVLRDKMQTDSVSVLDQLGPIVERIERSGARKFDSDPLPLKVMEVKIADLSYRSLNHAHRAIRDTADLQVRGRLIAEEMTALDALDSMVNTTSDSMVDAHAANYQYFIRETFNNPLVLKNFLRGLKDYVSRERSTLEESERRNGEALRWLLAAGDTIPIFPEVKGSAFQPLMIEDEKFTVGLYRKDTITASGYFCFITPTRIIDKKISFPVDQEPFMAVSPVSLKSLSTQSGNQVYYVLVFSSEVVNERFPTTLAKIYRSDGLSWSINRPFEFMPEELMYDENTGEVVVRSEENVVVFDKNGQEKR